VFHHQDNTLYINPKKKNIDFQLKTISSENFPELQQVDQSEYFEIGQKDVIEMISQTIFSVSEDETRYFMNGVYFVNNSGHLLMVATDGRRLSFISKNIPGIKEFNGIIIPSKILQLIKKLCSGEGNISLAVTDKHIFASFDNQRISSSLIEGQFPDYNRVIPEKQTHKVITSRDEFTEALRRVSLLVEQKSRRIYLLLKDGVLELHSEESDIGVARETIECNYTGEEVKIALNYIYLMDPLKIMETETFSINFTEATKALTLQAEPEAGYFHLIMPMQYE
jgi:DNA polymerase-3 subunit beta